MKAIVYGYTNGEHVILGELRLRGDRLMYAIHPKCGNADVAKRLLSDMVGESRLAPSPEAYLEALPKLYTGAYMGAKFVPDTKPVEKGEFVESEHPRAEDGKFSSGGGRSPEHEGVLPEQSYQDAPSAKDFIEVRDKNPRREFLSDLTEDALEGHTLVLNKEGNAGCVVAPNGDIQNVFRNPGAPRGAGTAATLEAVKRGGFMLDCYEYERKGRPGLPELYKKLGFVETGRMKFNAQYHPEWAKDGRTPDVVFMAYRGGDRTDSPKSTRYYGSTEWQKAKRDSADAATKITKYSETQPRDHGRFASTGGNKFDAGVHSRTLDEMRLPMEEQMRRQNERRRQRRPHIPADSPAGRAIDTTGRWLAHHPMKSVSLEEENKKIAENRGTYGTEAHLFERAEYTAGNGHSRCVRCGDEEPTDGLCIPELHKWAKLFDEATATWTAKFSSTFMVE